MNKKLRVERVALTLAISLVIVEVAYYIALKYERETQHVQEEQVVLQEMQEVQEKISFKEKLIELVEDVEEETKQEVYFTCYYPFDQEGTTTRTGSQLETKDFRINEYGMYTYQGKVVVACPTYEGLESQYGVLKNFNDPNPNIVYYHYFDEFTIEIEGIGKLDAICLDTIGAGMDWEYLQKYDGGLNRLDIFVAEKQYSFGKKKGFVK